MGCLVFVPDDPPFRGQGWVVVVGCLRGLTLPMPLMRGGGPSCVGGGGECGSGLAWPSIWQFACVVDASCTGWWVVARVVENLKKML